VVFQPLIDGAGNVGHVAWVTAVSGSNIDVSEMDFPTKYVVTSRTNIPGVNTGLTEGLTNIVYIIPQSNSGFTAITSVTSSGYLSTTLNKYYLYDGWKTIVREPGNGLEFFYNPSNGLADSVSFDSNGNWSLRWTARISPGWTSVVPLGNGDVVFYNASTGLTATGVFTASGALTTLTPGGFHLDPGWNSVSALGLGSGVMFYNVNNGVTAVGYINSAGFYQPVEAQTQSAGWAIVRNVQNLMTFYYNPNTGLSAVTVWNSQTLRLNTIAVYTISPGWTAISPTNTNGIWLFYNTNGHTAGTTFNTSNGSLTTLTPGGYNISKGWTTVTPLSNGLELFYTA
jgi:hypothetical protein